MTLHRGDLFDVLPTLPADSVDACVTDPPYELAFMGKRWDATGVAFRTDTWQQVYRVLKPGAFLLAFGGTRTSHRMVCAIEDVGFEIRDSISFMFGTGFPKALNVGKAIDKEAGHARERIRGVRSGVVATTYAQDAWSREFKDSVLSPEPLTDAAAQWNGWATSLKPAHEPICVARKPLIGTVAQNVLTHGTGAMNIDACRIAGEPTHGSGASMGGMWSMSDVRIGIPNAINTAGRWPANVIFSHNENCTDEACVEECAVKMLDTQTGVLDSHGGGTSTGIGYGGGSSRTTAIPKGDSGGPSRFYYCSKPSRSERNIGLNGAASTHPTVKPLALMRWLVRLVTPPAGTILDPFAGSGTTGMACVHERVSFIGIEKEPEYADIAARRIAATVELVCAPIKPTTPKRTATIGPGSLFDAPPSEGYEHGV